MKNTMLSMELIVARPTAVKLQDMTLEDLNKMEHKHLAEIAYGLIELLKHQPKVKTRTTKRKPVVEHPEAIEEVPIAVPAREPQPRGTGATTFGSKIGKSSIYHNVYRDKKSGRFRAGLQQNKHYKVIGSSFSELEAAMMVDDYLDEIGDTKRPKNRDDHPEIMELYKRRTK